MLSSPGVSAKGAALVVLAIAVGASLMGGGVQVVGGAEAEWFGDVREGKRRKEPLARRLKPKTRKQSRGPRVCGRRLAQRDTPTSGRV